MPQNELPKRGTPLGPNPGPDFALRQSDAEEMQRAMKGVTTSRAAGMAHQTIKKVGGDMPLNKKGQKIMSSMKDQYGAKKGELVFHASKNAGTIKGVEHAGGTIPSTGMYLMERGETVSPAPHGHHTGAAENMTPFGPDESSVARANAPFRDLHKSGHDLNHSYKNPVPAVAPDVKAAGTNHSYLHPHSHSGMREAARTGFNNANRIKPMSETGTGKS